MDKEKKLIDFMRAEIGRTRKGVGRTYLLGALAALLIGGYMAFILSMVREATNGQFLAIAVRNQVETALPGMIQSSEQALGDKASVLANGLSRRFLRLVPELAAAGRAQIDASYQDQIPYLSDEFSAIVRDYIQENHVALETFADQHTGEEFAREFTRQIMAEFARQLDTRIRDHNGEDGLVYFHDSVLTGLVAMDSKLDELLARPTDELTQRERLQRRILAHLVLAVTREKPQS